MQKWEYLLKIQARGYTGILTGGGKPTKWEGDVNLEQLGQEGWELIAVVPISSFHSEKDNGFTTELYYYFKRPLSS